MFCTLRNLSPPWAVNAAFASSSGVLSGVITTAAGAAAAGAGVLVDGVVLAPPWSCATTVTAQPSKQIDKKTFFISKTFRSEVQSHLSIDATITGSVTAASGPTQAAKCRR